MGSCAWDAGLLAHGSSSVGLAGNKSRVPLRACVSTEALGTQDPDPPGQPGRSPSLSSFAAGQRAPPPAASITH